MNIYVLVTWPYSQSYMEEEWFQEEAFLADSINGAYFIPIEYYKKNEDNENENDLKKNNQMDAYVLVTWPNSQDYMEEEWFQEEAFPANSINGGYFIPIEYYKKNEGTEVHE